MLIFFLTVQNVRCQLKQEAITDLPKYHMGINFQKHDNFYKAPNENWLLYIELIKFGALIKIYIQQLCTYMTILWGLNLTLKTVFVKLIVKTKTDLSKGLSYQMMYTTSCRFCCTSTLDAKIQDFYIHPSVAYTFLYHYTKTILHLIMKISSRYILLSACKMLY